MREQEAGGDEDVVEEFGGEVDSEGRLVRYSREDDGASGGAEDKQPECDCGFLLEFRWKKGV